MTAIERLEAVASRLEAVASRLGGGEIEDGDVPFWVTDYENIMKTEVTAAVKACNDLGIPQVGDLLQKAYTNTLGLIQRAPNTKKPKPQELLAYMEPGIEAIKAADTLRYKGKSFRKWGDHYKAMYEAVMVVSWVTMAPPNGMPAQHVEGQVQSCDFHLTRIQRREKDAKTKAWLVACRALNKKVKTYVTTNFKKTGLTFNPKGTALSDASPVKKTVDDQKEEPAKKSKNASGGGKGMGGVFAQLNKGTDITKGMKKVTKSMKTKYRADRSGKVVMKSKTKKSRKKYGSAGISFKGGRWMVENYDEGVIEVDQPTVKQNVFITMCDTCTVNIISDKVKAVCIDSCVKVRVFLNAVVSTVEIINCKSVTLFLQGVVPSVSIEKSESSNIVLNKVSYLEPPLLVTSNISATNIQLPGATEDDDPTEIPIPEQFLTTIDNKRGTIETHAAKH